jgi:hypothetical protein
VFWDLSNPAKRFYIDDIKEIRVGADARNFASCVSWSPWLGLCLAEQQSLFWAQRQRRERDQFREPYSAKVFWDLSNPAKRFYIDDIKEIRVGADARNYREANLLPAFLGHLG